MKGQSLNIIAIAVLVSANAVAQEQASWHMKLAHTIKPEERKQFSWAAGTPSGGQNPAIHVKSSDPNNYFFDFDLGVWRSLTSDESRRLRESRSKKDKIVLEAWQNLRKGDTQRAIAVARQVLIEDDLYELASRLMCEALLHEGKFGEALAVLAPFAVSNTDIDLLNMVAYAGAMSGHAFSGQREFCNRYVMDFASSLGGVAESLPALDSLEGAKVSGTLARASYYLRHGLRQDAKRYFLRALELEPGNAYANYSLGQLFETERAWKQAAEHYQVAATTGFGRLKEKAKSAADWMRVRASRDG